MPIRIMASFAATWLASVVAAQRPVVTVGGLNPNHADLPQAVAAAVPGSILAVRPGTYTGFTSQKALRLVMHSATVLPAPGSNYTIQLQNITGSDPFVIYGIDSSVESATLGAVRVNNTLAPVILEGVALFAGPSQAALDVFNAGAVHIARSLLVGSPGLQAQFANLILNDDIIGNAYGAGAIVSMFLSMPLVRSSWAWGSQGCAASMPSCDWPVMALLAWRCWAHRRCRLAPWKRFTVRSTGTPVCS